MQRTKEEWNDKQKAMPDQGLTGWHIVFVTLCRVCINPSAFGVKGRSLVALGVASVSVEFFHLREEGEPLVVSGTQGKHERLGSLRELQQGPQNPLMALGVMGVCSRTTLYFFGSPVTVKAL
jgi:hypothetical protein